MAGRRAADRLGRQRQRPGAQRQDRRLLAGRRGRGLSVVGVAGAPVSARLARLRAHRQRRDTEGHGQHRPGHALHEQAPGREPQRGQLTAGPGRGWHAALRGAARDPLRGGGGRRAGWGDLALHRAGARGRPAARAVAGGSVRDQEVDARGHGRRVCTHRSGIAPRRLGRAD